MSVVEPKQKTAAGGKGPAVDNRLKILEATMKRHQYQPDALIEVLHKAQEIFGYISPDLLQSITRKLKLPASRVYGVATFYHFFSLVQPGEHSCVVCMGTACYVKGAADVLQTIEQQAGVRVGETTADQRMTLMSARCIGACGIAPAVVFDGSVVGHQTTDTVLEYMKGWLGDGSC